MTWANKIHQGPALDILRTMPDGLAHTCVTSPPYWGLRDYGVEGQLGLEETPQKYVDRLAGILREVRRVLRDDGTLWLNLGDSYAANRSYQVSDGKHKAHDYKKSNAQNIPPGLKPKDLVGIPWMVAFTLQAYGWYLRNDIIWHKPNPMPESATDRCTTSHEYIFLLSKSARYYFDNEAISEPLSTDPNSWGRHGSKDPGAQHPDNKPIWRGDRDGTDWGNGETRNKRTVWTVATKPFGEAHFATFPPKLIEPCIKAGAPTGGVVLDPFMGAGTTALVARNLNRDYIGIELNPEYIKMANDRIHGPLFAGATE